MRQARRNNRIYKKHCKKAKELLLSIVGYHKDDFTQADGDDAATYDVKIGTWLFWSSASWEYDEWDAEPAFEVLSGWIFWELSEFDQFNGDIISQPKFKTPYDCIRQAEAYIAKNERTKKGKN